LISRRLGPELESRPALFVLVVLLPLALGILFRFTNLDRKVYWTDEAVTSLWLSAHGFDELIARAFDGHEMGVEDLMKYQHVTPGRSIADTISVVADGDPHLPPLYLMLLRVWAMVFGDSVASVRSLSAVVSVFALGALYWLAIELTGARLTAWIAVALLSVSPFQVAYAQEARVYSLWMFLILGSTAALLRSLRNPTIKSWALYALTVVLGIHSHLLFGIVIIAHGGYVAGIHGGFRKLLKLPKPVKQYALATGVAMVIFLPWAIVTVRGIGRIRQQVNWAFVNAGIQKLIANWGAGVTRTFFDLDRPRLGPEPFGLGDVLLIVLLLLLECLTVYALFHFWRSTANRVWLLVFLLIGTTAVVVISPDLLLGSRFSFISRYWAPCYLAIIVAVAHLFATHLFSPQKWRRALGRVSFATVLVGGVVSCIVSSQAQHWLWTKGPFSNELLHVARIVNQTDRPLLIGDASMIRIGNVLSLGHLLEQDVRLQFVYKADDVEMSGDFSTIFLFQVSDRMRQRLATDLNVPFERVEGAVGLWRSAKSGRGNGIRVSRTTDDHVHPEWDRDSYYASR
jgi:uncharacterized membrane protein